MPPKTTHVKKSMSWSLAVLHSPINTQEANTRVITIITMSSFTSEIRQGWRRKRNRILRECGKLAL